MQRCGGDGDRARLSGPAPWGRGGVRRLVAAAFIGSAARLHPSLTLDIDRCSDIDAIFPPQPGKLSERREHARRSLPGIDGSGVGHHRRLLVLLRHKSHLGERLI